MDKKILINALKQHISAERFAKIESVSRQRTRYINVVVEDVFYTQNVSSIIRSCEALGIQDFYIIGTQAKTKVNKHVSLGASGWIDIHRESSVPGEQVLEKLKKQGYRIAASVLDESALSLYDFDITKGKTSLVLGNEMHGISQVVRQYADEYIYIPMWGFSDSFNISIAASMILYDMVRNLRQSCVNWQLSPDEIDHLQYLWIKSSMRRSSEVESEYEIRLSHPNDQCQ